MFSHLRYTVQLLLKSPGFTITAVLILGLGIGANTAIFSLVNCVLLKPLPYPNPDRLVSVYQTIQGDEKSQFDYPDYLDVRANQRTLDSITAFYPDDVTLTGRGEPERISAIYASGSLFKVLGRPFLIGKPFGETEDNSETRSVVVISEHLWNTKFQRDPQVLGANLLCCPHCERHGLIRLERCVNKNNREWTRIDANKNDDLVKSNSIRVNSCPFVVFFPSPCPVCPWPT